MKQLCSQTNWKTAKLPGGLPDWITIIRLRSSEKIFFVTLGLELISDMLGYGCVWKKQKTLFPNQKRQTKKIII
jgi:hypothetical protein